MSLIKGAVAAAFIVSTANVFLGLGQGNAEETNYAALNDQEIQEKLQETATEMNRKLPTQVDDETRLDRVYSKNKTLRYSYTLVNYSASEIPAADLREHAEDSLIAKVCSMADKTPFDEMGIQVEFSYKGNDGRSIVAIPVSFSQCDSA